MARLYTYQITLSNTTSTATSPNLQVRLNINFASLVSNINADLGNIRFSSDPAGFNLLYAWLESAPQGTFTQSSSLSSYTSSNIWVNLGNNIIPANGSLNIYMQILSSGTEFDGVYWGANPLWTSTYGQYDNGAKVFSIYFNGNTSVSDFSVDSASSLSQTTAVFSNGATINVLKYLSTSTATPTDALIYTGSSVGAGEWISESSFASDGSSTDMGVAGLGQYTSAGTSDNMIQIDTQYSGTYFGESYVSSAALYIGLNLQGTTTTSFRYAALYDNATNSFYGYISPQLYSTSGGYSGTVSANPISSLSSIYWMVNPLGRSAGHWVEFNWGRVRAYPPNGTDPVLTSISILPSFVGNYVSVPTSVPEWNILRGKPYILVSGKGISNGLSNIPNDGADFGPDTLLGTNSIGQYGPPYTQTTGIQEAWNYSVATAHEDTYTGKLTGLPIYLDEGPFYINSPITFSAPPGKLFEDPKLEGISSMAPYIICNINGEYAITYNPDSFGGTNIRVSNMQPMVGSGYAPLGFIKADFSTAYTWTNPFESYNLDFGAGGWTEAPLYLNYMLNIFLYNYQVYGGTGTYSGGYFNCNGETAIIGGFLSGEAPPTFTGPSSGGSNSVTLVNVTFNAIVLEHVISALIVGNQSYSTNVYLNDNIPSLTIIGGGNYATDTIPIVQVLTPGDTWTVGLLTIKGYAIMNSSTFSILGPGVTVLNSDITLVNPNGAIITYPLIVPTTPSVPASGTAQQNTNPYPVNVYLYGGTVTAIYYTPDGGTAVQVGTSGPATVHLNPNDSITLTYSAAPTWVWTKA